MKASELFRKYPKIPVFDHSNYRLFERIPAVPGTSNIRGLTVVPPRKTSPDITGKLLTGT